ncbi:hypothetical protein FMM80_22995 [Schaedlerella arabinosiphila]|uniref:Uncharacterized protein n=1 Tax=Schaedlerella arabinosiphila TaxID=2044587 RepID=A0A9X5CDM7_9FIRM|nr:hypothetical protein [Schaedlerella arabinosiphila]KAI4442330.1 hypothetical protein C824_004841 [Schaedlerella arabinosiphila]NDO71358.1 hypothetical protein [Schaedlerella arabinosiphila]
MQIKISNLSQLLILRNINPLLNKYKIPRMVLHEIGNILTFKRNSENDYVVLFLEPIKNDITGILDKLSLYIKEVELSDENIHTIEVEGKKHPMKRNRIWSWYDISVPSENHRIIVVYSMKEKDIYNKKGGF